MLETRRTNSIFSSSAGSTGKAWLFVRSSAFLEKQPLAGGWKAGNTCYGVVLCIPEAGKEFQEKLARLIF